MLGLDVSSVFGSVYVAHGSPRDPLWEYLTNLRLAEINFGYFGTQMCLVGHTHVPITFRWRAGRARATGAFSAVGAQRSADAIDPGADRLIFNPGSVGQPRDGDPRAAYAHGLSRPPVASHFTASTTTSALPRPPCTRSACPTGWRSGCSTAPSPGRPGASGGAILKEHEPVVVAL